jgi:predicted nucleotidyltransferase component of viral defense system
MNVFDSMMAIYPIQSDKDYLNALHEVMQKIALAGLHRGNFFKRASFYGGTCLHLFHQLPRFSEDMDFSLLQEDASFSLDAYTQAIVSEFKALGRDVTFARKEKPQNSTIESAFLKDNTAIYNLSFKTERTVKIKIEVDTSPPLGFTTMNHTMLLPFSFVVSCFDLPCLYAGKMHALLFRNWKSRVKGRDWYDLEWYVRHRIKIDLPHFCQRMKQSHPHHRLPQTVSDVKILLKDRISTLNIEQAKDDVLPFIMNRSELDIWSQEYFTLLADQIV